MRITDKERAVLAALDHLGNQPSGIIAKAAKVSVSTARYVLEELKEKDLITPLNSKNPFALDFHQYTLYFL